MKKYHVMTVLGYEKLTMPITVESNCVKLYAYNVELCIQLCMKYIYLLGTAIEIG